MMIKYQQIRHALALLERGSFRKAAHAQHISQPAFSRSIAKLEEGLGVELFHRHPSGVTATVYGEILSKYSHKIVADASRLEREIHLLKGLGKGELSVAMGPYPAEISGHRAVGALVASHPALHCRITVSDWFEVERLVETHTADIGIADITEAEKNRHLTVEALSTHRIVFYCRPGHPLLRKKTITKDDVINYPMVLMKPAKRFIHIFKGKLFDEEKSRYMTPSIEIEDLACSRQIVAQSQAVSGAAPVQIRNELMNATFVVVPLNVDWMALNYGFIFAKDRALSPAAIKFMALVRKIETDMAVLNEALMEKYLPSREHRHR